MITVLGVAMDTWAALGLAVQFLLPMLVGLVTTKETNRQLQFTLLAGLTLLSTVATQLLANHDAGVSTNLVQILVTAVANFAISLLSHYTVWKPTQLTAMFLSVFSKPAPVGPAPLDPTPAAPAAALPARHLSVVPTPAPGTVAAVELPLEPVPAPLAS